MKSIVIFLDFETNGRFGGRSVLSASAIQAEFLRSSFQRIATMTRYYFPIPGETCRQNKGEINAMTPPEIMRLRAGAKYSLYFREDKGFVDFCAGCRKFVAHNAYFERCHMPCKIGRYFCTMRRNTDIVKARWLGSRKKWKWPTLDETAAFYGVPILESKRHTSIYDTEVLMQIFIEMYRRRDEQVLNFLGLM